MDIIICLPDRVIGEDSMRERRETDQILITVFMRTLFMEMMYVHSLTKSAIQ